MLTSALHAERPSISIVTRLLLVFAMLLAIACDSVSDPSSQRLGDDSARVSDGPAGAVFAKSEKGFFKVAAWPEMGVIPLRRIHSWLVRVEDATGKKIKPVRIAVDGGMPEHGHGFDTAPRVTERLPNGDYRIDGMKFHMNGNWQLELEIFAEGRADKAIFQINVALPGTG